MYDEVLPFAITNTFLCVQRSYLTVQGANQRNHRHSFSVSFLLKSYIFRTMSFWNPVGFFLRKLMLCSENLIWCHIKEKHGPQRGTLFYSVQLSNTILVHTLLTASQAFFAIAWLCSSRICSLIWRIKKFWHSALIRQKRYTNPEHHLWALRIRLWNAPPKNAHILDFMDLCVESLADKELR